MKYLIILLLLCSCATADPVCRHWADFAAATWADLEGDEVRVGVGYTKDFRRRGAWAEARIGGVWTPIAYSYGKVRVIGNAGFYHVEYMTLEEFRRENDPKPDPDNG